MSPPGVVRDDGRTLAFTTPESLRHVADSASRMSDTQHLLPLLHGAARGDLALAVLQDAATPFPERAIARTRRPVVVLVGDDPWPDGEALGPCGWACAGRLRWWQPQVVIVHGTGPHPDHYRIAVDAASSMARIAFIETDSAHMDAWARFLDCPATLRIGPPAGRAHPDKASPGTQPC